MQLTMIRISARFTANPFMIGLGFARFLNTGSIHLKDAEPAISVGEIRCVEVERQDEVIMTAHATESSDVSLRPASARKANSDQDS